MNLNVIHVGIDVDDVRYHGCALDQRTGEALQFQCRATLKGLLGQLEEISDYVGGGKLKLCDEASYVGFSLQRDLGEQNGRPLRHEKGIFWEIGDGYPAK